MGGACVIRMDHRKVTKNSFERKSKDKIKLGQASLTWLEYVEHDVGELKMMAWRQKANNKRTYVVNEVKVLRGL
jgi:hypothetical protein